MATLCCIHGSFGHYVCILEGFCLTGGKIKLLVPLRETYMDITRDESQNMLTTEASFCC